MPPVKGAEAVCVSLRLAGKLGSRVCIVEYLDVGVSALVVMYDVGGVFVVAVKLREHLIELR